MKTILQNSRYNVSMMQKTLELLAPAGDWYDVPLPKSRPRLFNYDRTLA
jgi:hypothetical protein